ncbi:hypothetical protein SAMN05444161_5303 [Rhizobiales bacterium GAS191]|nr:hypothetical protein SAMN05444161_5303 [Rhizobiales bacterium GAS191]
MTPITYHVVLPIVRTEDGELVAEDGLEAPSPSAAVSRARALSSTRAGAVAFSRSGDPDTGEYSEAVILARFGETPSDIDRLA